jgi:hypothetical protein
MVPARLIALPELPKNTNMKVDRSRLPSSAATPSAAAADAPRSGDTLEGQIAAIIAGLLDVPSFGHEENFFDGGGQSMLAIRLLTQVGRRFDADMTLADFFEDPTARGVAAFVRQGRS